LQNDSTQGKIHPPGEFTNEGHRLMDIEKIIDSLDPVEQAAFMEAAEEYIASLDREEAQTDFIKFAHAMWPGFIDGRHHR
jgi:hypothetical protein